MKRLIYIAIVAVGFLAVSCSKENIQPTAQNSQEVPVWKSTSTGGSTNGSNPDGSGSGTGSGTITDPNSDKDESTRRKN